MSFLEIENLLEKKISEKLFYSKNEAENSGECIFFNFIFSMQAMFSGLFSRKLF